jgi:hypothetical protein
MKSRKSKPIVLYSMAVGFGACLAAASGVMAQQQEQKAEGTDQAAQKPVASVSIQQQAQLTPATGSHIKRVRAADPSLPLLELDRAYIDRSGATNPAELIRTVPQAQSH